MNQGKYRKLVTIISLLSITSILFIIARIPPARGYEISIYRVFPWYFWVIIILSYIWGVSIGFNELFNKEVIDRYLVSVPILTMGITTSILLLMPLFRGYATYGRGDVLGHIGLIKDILVTGSFGDNWYPTLHIWGASLSEISNINPKTIAMIFPIVMLILYLTGIFYFSKEFFGRKLGLGILMFNLMPIYTVRHIFMAAGVLPLFFLPLALLLFVRANKDNKYLFLYILVLFPFIIAHPHRGLFFIIILVLTLTLSYNHNFFNLKYKQRSVSLILLPLAIWILWYTIYYNARRTIYTLRSFIIGFLGFAGTSEEVSATVSEYSPPLIYYIKVGTYSYGLLGIILLLSLVFILLYFINKSKISLIKKLKIVLNQGEVDKDEVIYSKEANLIVILFLFFAIFHFFIGGPGGSGRIRPYLFLFSTFLITFFIYLANRGNILFMRKLNINKLIYLSLVLLILLSVFSLYGSPWQVNQNSQATDMEFSGMKWTFENRNDSLLIDEMVGLRQHRFHSAIYRRNADRDYIRYKRGEQVSRHFGYEGNETLGSQYEKDTYLVISEFNRVRYQELYPGWEYAQFFVEEDFEKLEDDRTVDRIYSNGEFDTYYINSKSDNT